MTTIKKHKHVRKVSSEVYYQLMPQARLKELDFECFLLWANKSGSQTVQLAVWLLDVYFGVWKSDGPEDKAEEDNSYPAAPPWYVRTSAPTALVPKSHISLANLPGANSESVNVILDTLIARGFLTASDHICMDALMSWLYPDIVNIIVQYGYDSITQQCLEVAWRHQRQLALPDAVTTLHSPLYEFALSRIPPDDPDNLLSPVYRAAETEDVDSQWSGVRPNVVVLLDETYELEAAFCGPGVAFPNVEILILASPQPNWVEPIQNWDHLCKWFPKLKMIEWTLCTSGLCDHACSCVKKDNKRSYSRAYAIDFCSSSQASNFVWC